MKEDQDSELDNSPNWLKAKQYWKQYATAFAGSLQANDLLNSFIANPAVTGAFAESWTRATARTILPQLRISTGAIIRSSDNLRDLKKIPQCDVIIWDPSELPALFEYGEFALVPNIAARAIIEVKRNNRSMTEFKEQLVLQRNCLTQKRNILGLVFSSNKPLFQGKVTPSWLSAYDHLEMGPAITRLICKKTKTIDHDGVFTFIYFLSQVAGHSSVSIL